MKTSDIFRTRAKKINESMEKVFGTKLNLETFDLHQLQDARNKLRTQVSQVRSQSGFNENLENEAFHQAQWMLDAINAEIAEREEFISDPSTAEMEEGYSSEAEEILAQLANAEDWDGIYDMHKNLGRPGPEGEAAKIIDDMYSDVAGELGAHADDDFEAIYNEVLDRLIADYGDSDADQGGETDDAYALASAGHGSDEDYGSFGGHEESVEQEGAEFGAYYYEQLAQKVFDENPNLSTKGRADEVMNAGWKFAVQDLGKKRAQWEFGHDEDFPSDFVSAYAELQRGGEQQESAPPTAKGERMVKHIKKGYAKDGKLTDKEKSIAYATAWKQHNKDTNESVDTGEDMTTLREGEVQQASAIVTAKTMVDRVSRWIEELSGMENDTLLQLGDSIRDEMSAEQAKSFISQCAPAIQAALENLKTTRETLSTGVRMLTGEEQGAEMLGSEPGAEPDMGTDEFGGEAEPDAMNAGDELDNLAGAPEDEFGASDAAVGGLEAAGREKRESVDFGNKLLKVLAG